MIYDAENRMVMATSGGGGSYTYDGEGRRVKRAVGGQEWWNVYGIGGELIAEYLASAPSVVKKEYGYREGQLLVVWDGEEAGDKQLKWIVEDHLGSVRMEADRSGSLAGMVRHDYLPFGEELYAGLRRNGSGEGQYSYEPPQSNVRQRFTSKERDNESGLDYFLARYYSSSQGRFTSADPFYIEAKRWPYPQSWNLYAYTRNNPLKYIDDDGLEIKITRPSQQVIDETVADLNKRKGAQFQIEVKDGKLAVVGQVDASKLSKSERAL